MLLFAVGDGNHSLATAKECYERQKRLTPPEHWDTLPARFALVELNNLHDTALEFEPIHRVVFGVEPQQLLAAMEAYYPGLIHGEGEGHVLPYVWGEHQGTITVPNPKAQLPVATLQRFLDDYLQIIPAGWTISMGPRWPGIWPGGRIPLPFCCPPWARRSCSPP